MKRKCFISLLLTTVILAGTGICSWLFGWFGRMPYLPDSRAARLLSHVAAAQEAEDNGALLSAWLQLDSEKLLEGQRLDLIVRHLGKPTRRSGDDSFQWVYWKRKGTARLGVLVSSYDRILSLDTSADYSLQLEILKAVERLQFLFYANDPDRNGVNDYWTADIAGLLTHSLEPIPGILESDTAALDSAAPPIPYKGRWWFRAMGIDWNGQRYAQDPDGDGHPTTNRRRFGVCMYPSNYGPDNSWSFIVDQDAVCWRKDTSGIPQLSWPANPLEENWERISN